MTKFVAILNLTPDSFSDGGKFIEKDAALKHLQQLLDSGADMIDIGAESTRPGAIPISAKQEWQRLKDILPFIIDEIREFEKKSEEDNYNFTTKGSYITVGFNKNTFKNWLEMDNEIYYGARYGFSAFSQKLNTYTKDHPRTYTNHI